MNILVTHLAAALCCVAISVSAQSVPALMNYQGQIQNPEGSVPPTADYELSFRIYDASSGGSMVWGPQVFDGTGGLGKGPKIPVVQGYFNVMLGQFDTAGRSLAGVFDTPTRFIEITVSNRPAIAPRQQFLSAPFAFRSGNADKLAGFDWGDLMDRNDPASGKLAGTKISDLSITTVQVGNAQITTEKLENASVTESKLADSQVSTAKLQDAAITERKIGDGQVTTSKLGPNSVTGEKLAASSVGLAHIQPSIVSALVPAGTIVAYGGNTPPLGWLLCDGKAHYQSNYPALFGAINTAWGGGYSNTVKVADFNLPDLRGLFLRGVNGTRSDNYSDPDVNLLNNRINIFQGGNPGNQVGSYQRDEFRTHVHSETRYLDVTPPQASRATPNGDDAGRLETVDTGPAGGSTETRPRNAYVHYIIKF